MIACRRLERKDRITDFVLLPIIEENYHCIMFLFHMAADYPVNFRETLSCFSRRGNQKMPEVCVGINVLLTEVSEML